ncbi:serine hydrolase domain-containing protein [Spirosoma arcticum]
MTNSFFRRLCFGLLLPASGLAQQSADSNQLTGVAKTVDSVFADWNNPHTPGGAIAVLYQGNVVFKKGYGMANVSRKIPISTTHLFNIASTAKQFTATCIALLEQEGKLSFDDDIKRYFPLFQLTKTVTIRHLLSHTSGLREGYVLAALSGKVNLKGQVKRKYKTTHSLLTVMAKQRDLNFSPGEEFAYTNINYILLGEIVRQVSGLSLRDYADQVLFKPLGMSHTYFNDLDAAPNPNRAIPYQYADNDKQTFRRKPIKNDQGVVGDNNLITSVDDLILWIKNFDNNRLGTGKSSLLKTLQTRHVLNNGDTTHYAFGLNITPYKNTVSVGHGGDDYRYTSFMVRFPDQQIAIICLSNQSRYENTQSKVFAVANALLRVPASPANITGRPGTVPFRADSLGKKLGRYMGNSSKNRYSFRELFIRNNKPYLSFQPQPAKNAFELVPITHGHYLFKVEEPAVYVELWIEKSKQSANYQIVERFKQDTLRFDKTVSNSLPAKWLMDYAGTYTSQELDGQLKVKVGRDGLRVVRGVIKIRTIPVHEDTFYAPENRTLFYFKRNESGSVKALSINAVDFRNVLFSK